MAMQTCMFTGHRPQNLPFSLNERERRYTELKERLKELIEFKITEQNISNFITGMAIGIDCICAEIVIALTKKYPYLSLTAVIPCADQTIRWRRNDVIRYNAILKKCSQIIILQQHYTTDCMNRRNFYMVEHCDCVIAVWDGSRSGTGNTVRYALEKRLPVTILNPRTFDISNLNGKS